MIMDKSSYHIKTIDRKLSDEYILDIHYAKRYPSISYMYGLFKTNILVGVISYGKPPSPNLKNGIAGKKYSKNVIELG